MGKRQTEVVLHRRYQQFKIIGQDIFLLTEYYRKRADDYTTRGFDYDHDYDYDYDFFYFFLWGKGTFLWSKVIGLTCIVFQSKLRSNISAYFLMS